MNANSQNNKRMRGQKRKNMISYFDKCAENYVRRDYGGKE